MFSHWGTIGKDCTMVITTDERKKSVLCVFGVWSPFREASPSADRAALTFPSLVRKNPDCINEL